MMTLRMSADQLARFWAYVSFGGGCWEWQGALSSGYGRFALGRRSERAHRISYVLEVGPIGEGLFIDHLCLNRQCVRPDHLEAVTPTENVRRLTRTITHCPKGHPYAGDNLRIDPRGFRRCRECHRLEMRTGSGEVRFAK